MSGSKIFPFNFDEERAGFTDHYQKIHRVAMYLLRLCHDDIQSFTEKFGRLPSTVVKCSSSRPPEGVLGMTPPTQFRI